MTARKDAQCTRRSIRDSIAATWAGVNNDEWEGGTCFPFPLFNWAPEPPEGSGTGTFRSKYMASNGTEMQHEKAHSQRGSQVTRLYIQIASNSDTQQGACQRDVVQ